jgi:hypothetical protein
LCASAQTPRAALAISAVSRISRRRAPLGVPDMVASTVAVVLLSVLLVRFVPVWPHPENWHDAFSSGRQT